MTQQPTTQHKQPRISTILTTAFFVLLVSYALQDCKALPAKKRALEDENQDIPSATISTHQVQATQRILIRPSPSRTSAAASTLRATAGVRYAPVAAAAAGGAGYAPQRDSPPPNPRRGPNLVPILDDLAYWDIDSDADSDDDYAPTHYHAHPHVNRVSSSSRSQSVSSDDFWESFLTDHVNRQIAGRHESGQSDSGPTRPASPMFTSPTASTAFEGPLNDGEDIIFTEDRHDVRRAPPSTPVGASASAHPAAAPDLELYPASAARRAQRLESDFQHWESIPEWWYDDSDDSPRSSSDSSPVTSEVVDDEDGFSDDEGDLTAVYEIRRGPSPARMSDRTSRISNAQTEEVEGVPVPVPVGTTTGGNLRATPVSRNRPGREYPAYPA
ncbi:hypothetical protein HK102_005010 [Quaeritorhiza haematococci]|nr:hypothetical protein HK102_005010 [Quaeritorhiza haematococci]